MRHHPNTVIKNQQAKARKATHAAILANRKYENQTAASARHFLRRQVTVGLRTDDSLPNIPFPLPPGYRILDSSGLVATVCANGVYLGVFAVSPRAAREQS